MNGMIVTCPPVRLGAIELIELGRTKARLDGTRRPFLANRGPDLGQLGFLADIGSFLAGAFEFLFTTLADLVNVPLELASQGVGVLFDGLAGFLANVPIIGELASQLLLVGKAVIQWGLSVPGLLLEGIGNIFGEVKGAIDAIKTPEEQSADLSAAKDKLLDKAEEKGGEEFKNAVKDAIEGKPVEDPETGETVPPKNPPPVGSEDIGARPLTGSDLGDKVLTVGLPIAGATAVALLLVG